MNAASDISAQDAGMPTIVLVHGAFADSSSWNGVIAHLSVEVIRLLPSRTRSAVCTRTPHTFDLS